MPRITKNQASRIESFKDIVEARYTEVDGYTIAFASYFQDFDPASYFKGLPEDRCQCSHWGVVVKGKIGFRSADGEEIIETGEAFYVRPGHTPVVYAGSEIIEFSLTEDLNKTMEVVTRNIESEQAVSEQAVS